MAVAILYVHLANGFFVANNGYELAGLVGVVALVLAISGAGAISLDRAIFGAKRRRRIREAREAGVLLGARARSQGFRRAGGPGHYLARAAVGGAVATSRATATSSWPMFMFRGSRRSLEPGEHLQR